MPLLRLILLLLTILLFFQNTCIASKNNYSDIPEIFLQISEKTNIPPSWLIAIAYKESKLNPYALNINGKAYYFQDPYNASLFLLEELAKNPTISYDIGLMQINKYWIEKYNFNILEILTPIKNLYLGALILKDCITRYKHNAFACYHTGRINKRGLLYQKKVKLIIKVLEEKLRLPPTITTKKVALK